MADYPIPTQLVVDERLVPAANAQVTVYDLNDTNNTTPLALKDLNGNPLPNPISTTANALSPNFISPVTDVKFVSPATGLALPVVSVEGLRNAAQQAADQAAAARQFVTGITVAATAGAAAAAAIDSAGKITFTLPQGAKGDKGDRGDMGPGGAPLVEDPTDPGTFNYGPGLAEDSTDRGTFLIGV